MFHDGFLCMFTVLCIIIKVAYMNVLQVTDLLTTLYYFYNNSPKKIRELKELADVMDMTKASKPGKSHGTRWIGHKLSALKKLYKYQAVYLSHLEQLIEDPGSTSKGVDKAKYKNYITKLKADKLVCLLPFFLDMLTAVNEVSLALQYKDVNLISMMHSFETLYFKLDAMHGALSGENTQNQHLNALLPYLCEKYPDPADMVDSLRRYSNEIQRIITNVRGCMETRFNKVTMEGDVLKNAPVILNIVSWPRSSEELVGFGKEAFSALYNHFKELLDFPKDVTECDVVNQFEGFKLFVSTRYTGLLDGENFSLANFWQTQLNCVDIMELFPFVLDIISVLLVLPLSNATLERNFSAMNRIVTIHRNPLAADRVTALMRIATEGPNLSEFDAQPVLSLWESQKIRRGGYKKLKT